MSSTVWPIKYESCISGDTSLVKRWKKYKDWDWWCIAKDDGESKDYEGWTNKEVNEIKDWFEDIYGDMVVIDTDEYPDDADSYNEKRYDILVFFNKTMNKEDIVLFKLTWG